MTKTTTPTMAIVRVLAVEIGAGAFLDRGGDLAACGRLPGDSAKTDVVAYTP